MTLGSYCIWWMAPGWDEVLGLPIAEKKVQLADPEVRARLLESARRPEAGVGGTAARMGTYRFGATNAPQNEGLEGRLVAEVAAERGLDDFACVAEASAAEDFDLDFWPVRPVDPHDDPSYRVGLWESPDVLIGGSDAGAAPRPPARLGVPDAVPRRRAAREPDASTRTGGAVDDRGAGVPVRPA